MRVWRKTDSQVEYFRAGAQPEKVVQYWLDVVKNKVLIIEGVDYTFGQRSASTLSQWTQHGERSLSHQIIPLFISDPLFIAWFSIDCPLRLDKDLYRDLKLLNRTGQLQWFILSNEAVSVIFICSNVTAVNTSVL